MLTYSISFGNTPNGMFFCFLFGSTFLKIEDAHTEALKQLAANSSAKCNSTLYRITEITILPKKRSNQKKVEKTFKVVFENF